MAAPVPDTTVIVRGDRIVAVGRGVTVPNDAAVVDARGRWMIPGMLDMHVHFWESARPGAQPTYKIDLTWWFPYDKEIAWMKARVPFTLSRYVCSGVTTVAVLGAIRGSTTCGRSPKREAMRRAWCWRGDTSTSDPRRTTTSIQWVVGQFETDPLPTGGKS
jgi:cytosine/adenosine deaminase-related metal-dependent hydrolase